MSNCYSEACFIIPDVTPNQLKHLNRFLEMDPDEHTYSHDELGLFDDPDYPDPGFKIELDHSSRNIYVQGNGENFYIENAVDILHHVFFAPDQPDREDIIVSVAQWADKRRPDHFGGIGARISRNETKWVNTWQP